jgi:tape measure domain-containing protein
MAESNEYKVVFGADVSDAVKKLEELSASVEGLRNSISGNMNQIGANTTRSLAAFGSAIGNIGNKLTTAITAPLVGLGVASLKTSAEMEQISVSFEVFTGSAEVAKDTLKELKDLALKSPMQFQDIAKGTQTLLGYGLSAEQAVFITKMLGDVSGGSSDKFQRLSLAFGQVQASGKLMGQEARQMINAGFNPLQAISDKTGKSMAVLTKEMKNGQISVQDVADAFEAATSKGGRYYGMLDKQSQTLMGSFNKLKESITFALADIGNVLNDELRVGAGLRAFSGFIGELKDRFMELTPEAKEMNLKLIAIGVSIGPILIGISKLISLAKSLATTVSALSLSGGGLVKLLVSLAAAFVASKAAGAMYNDIMDAAIKKDPNLLRDANVELKQRIKHFDELIKKAPAVGFTEMDQATGEAKYNKSKTELIAERYKLYHEYANNYKLINDLEEAARKAEEAAAKKGKPKFDDKPPGGDAGNKEFDKAAKERQRLHDKWVADEAAYYGKLRDLDEANKLAGMRAREWWSTNYTEELKDMRAYFTGKIDEAKRYGAQYDGWEAEFASKRMKLGQKVVEALVTNRNKARKVMSDSVDARFMQDAKNSKQTASQAANQLMDQDLLTNMANYGQAFYSASKDLAVNLAAGFAEIVGTALFSGGTVGDAFKALGSMILNALGDYLIKIGTAAIAAGIVGTALKAFFTGGVATVPELGIGYGMAAVAIGGAMKALAGKVDASMDKNKTGSAISGASSGGSMSSKVSGSSYQYGGSNYSTQSVRLFVDLTGSITATSTGYSINKSMETTLRITGR